MLTTTIGLGSILHEELQELERELTHMPTESHLLVEQLLAVRRSLDLHVDGEEVDYLAEVLHQDPSRERAVRLLRNEHHRLSEQLCILMEDLELLTAITPQYHVQLANWVEGVRRYLAREDAMVTEVSNREIGVDD